MPSTAKPAIMRGGGVRRIFFLLLLCIFFAPASHAETLYQRSTSLFGLKARQTQAEDYTFVVLGDSRSNDAIFKKALQTAASYNPLFILHGGDYSAEGGYEETGNFLSLIEEHAAGIPVFVVLGNHENRKVFAKEIGPAHFTVQDRRLGLKVIALDNADDALSPSELTYLKTELASAPRTTFVAMHVPPQTKRWRGHTFTEGAAELERIVAASPVIRGLFFAHSHIYDRIEFGGIPAFISGGAGAPLAWMSRYGERINHIIVVRVKNGSATYQKVQFK